MNTEEKQDYYVYLHKRKDNGVVFYVGHGRTVRANQSGQGKTKDWKDVVSISGGYEIVKLHENLSKSKAIDLEEHYIKNPEVPWELVNKRLPTRVNSTPKETLAEKFYYDPESPSGLRYKESSYKNKGALSKAKDSVAGGVYIKEGKPLFWRLKFTVDGIKQALKVHRVVWMITNGDIPEHWVVDHIDGNPLNNKLENLRLVSQKVNARNKRINRISESGLIGICKNRNQYKVSISTDSDCRELKSFSINKYGEEKALYLAVKHRYNFLTKTKDGSEYSNGHSGIEDLLKIITDFESQGEYLGIGPTSI